jgi:hypothetical protein
MIEGMKVTIRDLLWLILVFAVAFGWLQSDRRRAAEVSDIRQLLDEWKTTTVDLLLRSGAAVFPTESVDSPDPLYAGQRRIVFQSERERQLFQELHAHGIRPVLLEPDSGTKP